MFKFRWKYLSKLLWKYSVYVYQCIFSGGLLFLIKAGGDTGVQISFGTLGPAYQYRQKRQIHFAIWTNTFCPNGKMYLIQICLVRPSNSRRQTVGTKERREWKDSCCSAGPKPLISGCDKDEDDNSRIQIHIQIQIHVQIQIQKKQG